MSQQMLTKYTENHSLLYFGLCILIIVINSKHATHNSQKRYTRADVMSVQQNPGCKFPSS